MPATKKASASSDGKASAFAKLQALLKKHAKGFQVQRTGSGWYSLETIEPLYKKKPLLFAGVRMGKAYTSFYLFQAYMFPKETKLSPALQKRKQGKSCFNFTQVDEVLFRELDGLLKAGAARFRKLTAEDVERHIKGIQGKA